MDVRLCERCTNPLPSSRLTYPNSRFCSEGCRWRSYHKKHRDTLRAYNNKWQKDNPDKVTVIRAKGRDRSIAYLKGWKERNPDRVRELRRASAKRTREANYKRQSAWSKENAAAMRASRKKWIVNNPDKRAASIRSRQLAQSYAEPSWLSKEQKKQIVAFYTEAARLTKEKGIPHEVDHIIPIRGKQVCGLHVPWNLQVLTSSENRRKSARV